MKYIIKNCPLYEQYDCFNIGKCKNSSCCNGIHIDFCKDIENCLLKQIVERANDCLAPEILELLEITESEQQ